MSEALDCSTKVDPNGFSIGLNFTVPDVATEGKDRALYVGHPGMKLLMERMAAVLRREPFDFEWLIQQAVASLAEDLGASANKFTGLINAARMAAGMPALISAEVNGEPAVPLADVEARVQQAVQDALARHTEGERQRTADAVRIALEAHEQEARATGGGAGVPDPGVPGATVDDPPPPRGTPKRAGQGGAR